MKLGIDRVLEVPDRLKHKRVGLVTNRSGVTSLLERNIDALLRSGVKIELIFSPEHGLYGAFLDGEKVREDRDRATGIPVVATYPDIESAMELTESLDIVIFDLQDVGARFYTYISTLKAFVEATQRHDFELWVADRPNPIGGFAEGWLPEPEFFSFVCPVKLPVRHGLTIGEIALIYAHEMGISDGVRVIQMEGWKRNKMFWDTGLPWVPPSPAIPTPQTALVYVGTGFIEGTNLSEGRGTARPFHLIGAPWLDGFKLAEKLNALNLPGVKFLPSVFKPTSSKHQGKICEGVEIFVLEPHKFHSVETGLRIIETVKSLWDERFEWRKFNGDFFIDKLAGTDKLRTAFEQNNLDDFLETQWISDEYADRIEQFLLYDSE